MGEDRVIVTEHEHDADGRLVRSVTRLPSRFTESDALLLLERQERQVHSCPGCGHDAREAWLPPPPSLQEWQEWSQEDRDAFTEQVRQIEAKWTPVDRVCAACQIGAKQARDSREPGRHTFVTPVRQDR